MTLTLIFSIFALVSAALTIFAQYRDAQRLEYVFKPLTMVWIILIVVFNSDPFSTRYQIIVLLGLLASLAGDVFLMLPAPKYFMYGLISFLTAHLFYIAAFTVEGGKAPLWYIAPFVLYGVIVLWQLWPHLGVMKRPVMIYIGVIMIMAWQAANRWIDARLDGSLWSMIGAYLFVMSDSALAVERFRGSWRSAPFWVLSTYFAAQWLIALSV